MIAANLQKESLQVVSLKSEAAFRRVRKRGRVGRTSLLTLRWLNNHQMLVEIGIVVSKKVGKAVVRNRLRRQLREAVRKTSWPACQAMIVVQPGANNASYAELSASLAKAAMCSELQ